MFGKGFPIGGLGKFPRPMEGKLAIFGKPLFNIGKEFLAREEFSTSWGRVISCLWQAFMSKRDFPLPKAGEKLFLLGRLSPLEGWGNSLSTGKGN